MRPARSWPSSSPTPRTTQPDSERTNRDVGPGRREVRSTRLGWLSEECCRYPASVSEKEIRRLRRQVRQLRNERDMNATAWCARETGPWEVYRFMSAHQGRFRVTVMARVLGVSTSGYYAWRGRPPSARARADAELTARVQEIHAGSRGTYGAPRIHAELVACGVAVGRKRVARVMRAAGITGVVGRWPAGSRTSRSG